jgi:hypothetical protein
MRSATVLRKKYDWKHEDQIRKKFCYGQPAVNNEEEDAENSGGSELRMNWKSEAYTVGSSGYESRPVEVTQGMA